MKLDTNDLQIMSNLIVLFGVIVAIGTIFYNIRTAKRTQTAIFLFESRTDKEYIESLHVLRGVHESGKSFRSYVFPCQGREITDAEILEKRKFQYILNFYERVAVSIQQGIYDEKMIKKTSYTTVIDTWNHAEPLIKAIREKISSNTTYQEFEWLAERWKKKPLKKKK
ncbi:DUF4760 domain-containing protein [Serratia sp. TKO39]|uniref:DUF4760 domain-containing protein n=1 Tax=Serratia sp. TKO39 TaxID=2052589 RepID=UPI000C24716B|nr:DUF4760 domain-containing protein [Serratia sp. TKO39]PJI67019.1 DUF4760 domain-containing protein [Serratia sp. TKO39]